MGIIKRQSLKSSLVNYLGVFLGVVFFNFIFPHILSKEYLGLIGLFQNIMWVFAALPTLGLPLILYKYFPLWKDTGRLREFERADGTTHEPRREQNHAGPNAHACLALPSPHQRARLHGQHEGQQWHATERRAILTQRIVTSTPSAPDALVAMLNESIRLAVQDPEIAARFEQLGFEPQTGTAEEFRALIQSDAAFFRTVVEKTGIKQE